MLITWEVGTFTQSKFVHIQSCKKESTPLKSKVLSGVYQDIIKKSVFLLVKKNLNTTTCYTMSFICLSL